MGARPTGVGAGGAVVLWGRSGLAGSLPRREFELGATAPGALREGLLFILAGCRPSRRRRTVSEPSDRLSTAVRMSRLAFGAPGCGGHAGGACPSTALKADTAQRLLLLLLLLLLLRPLPGGYRGV